MNFFLTTLTLAFSITTFAQTQITNADFEAWENIGSSNEEPTSWNSNKTGTGLASSGPQTCYKDATSHGGTSCVRVETKYYFIAVVNGNVTTGVVEAPSSNKSEGFLSATGTNKIAFTGRPDSLVGWYKYTQATGGTGAAAEQGKVLAYLHSGDFYDPEAPVSGNHSDLSANKIASALFVSPASNQTTWKRFSVPFNYVNSLTPAFVMVNITSSNNQLTVAPNSSSTGSKMWIDDLQCIYNPTSVIDNSFTKNVNVYYFDKSIFVDFKIKSTDYSTLEIYNATGQLVISKPLDNANINNIDVSTLNNGIYMYKVSSKSQGKFGKLFVNN